METLQILFSNPAFTSVLGAIVGGGMSLLATLYSENRQFKTFTFEMHHSDGRQALEQKRKAYADYITSINSILSLDMAEKISNKRSVGTSPSNEYVAAANSLLIATELVGLYAPQEIYDFCRQLEISFGKNAWEEFNLKYPTLIKMFREDLIKDKERISKF